MTNGERHSRESVLSTWLDYAAAASAAVAASASAAAADDDDDEEEAEEVEEEDILKTYFLHLYLFKKIIFFFRLASLHFFQFWDT